MAASNRDLTIGLISKMDRFDLSDAVKDLDKLGDAAATTGGEFDKTRKDLDAFMDKMKKVDGGRVRKELDDAGEGLRDLRQEAGQSGREAAASFSGGFDDVADLLQETAANAFAGFGPLGAAAGIAAAAGIGVLVTKFQEAKEKAEELRKELTSALIEGKGAMAPDSLTGRLQEMAADGSLLTLAGQAKILKVSAEDLMLAMAGDPAAMDRTTKALEKYGAGVDFLAPGQALVAKTLTDVRDGLSLTGDAYAQAELASRRYSEATASIAEKSAVAAEAEDKHAESLRALADTKHAAALDAIAASMTSVGDASAAVAEAVAEDGQVGIESLTKALKEATEATKDHRANVQKALKDGGEEFAAWVAEQGPEVSKAYAKGSAAQRKALREAFKANVGGQMGAGIKDGLGDSQTTISDAAGNLYNVVKDRLTGQQILIPVGINGPSAAQVQAVRADIRARFGTIEIPVVPKQFGQGRYIP